MSAELKLKFTGESRGATDAIGNVNTALSKLNPAANTATSAMTNFSRIVQDAPFGLIGVANNIEPLINSLISLKRESGSVGGALSALGGSLIGGGGLVLAVGLASFAMSKFGQASVASGKQARDAAVDIKTANDIIRDSAAGEQGEIAKVQALAQAVQDANKPYQERARALDELKRINKGYFGDLSLEESQMKRLREATDEYTKALVAQAVVKGFENEVGKLAVELAKSREELRKSGEEVVKYQAILDKAKKSQAATTATSGSVAGVASDPFATAVSNAGNNLATAKRRYEESAEATKTLANSYNDLQKGIKDATNELLKFQSVESKGGGSGGGGKTEKPFDFKAFFAQNQIDITEGLSKLDGDFQRQFKEIGQNSAKAYGTGFALDSALEFRRIQGIVKKVAELTALGFDVPSAEELIANPNINASYLDVIFPPTLVEDAAKRKKLLEDSILSIATGVQDALVSVADSIGSALGRGGSIGQVLAAGGEALLKVIGGVLQDVGKQVIVASGLVKLMQKALASLFTPAGPAAGIAIGASLIALGAVLKNIRLTKVQPFAEGGVVMGPTMGLVGEAGKEAIIPLNRIGDVLGSIGGGQSVFVTGRLSGETIFLQQQRTGGRRSRIV